MRISGTSCSLRHLLLALCVAGSGLQAAEPKPGNLATWCQFDLPPMYIVDGPDAGKGSVDTQAQFLMRHMPEYQHQSQFSNIRRVSEQMRNREHIVCAGMQKNAERETYMHFSLPFLGALPPTLVLAQRNLDRLRPYLNAAGEVRLSALIEGSPLILGIAFGRSYGRNIDAVMAAYKDRPNIMVRPSGQDLTEGLIKMMSLRRIDYTIVYGSELQVYSNALSGPENEIVSLPIEGLPHFIPVYITAPADEWGRVFIERINQLLRIYWNDSEFRANAFLGQTPAQRETSRAILRELNPNPGNHRSRP
ncbi:TIGR02285 family protein [Uliginosibacterium sp. H3]|uniref:TIGR02285 family protein n=1 Tax=Uliginosibacterium silvisoli TaxID=3114758 RepID=A0ABU6JZK0_9RHOO|nr:TIGR02285 family protein [Uliginosibacterium sp. H3]